MMSYALLFIILILSALAPAEAVSNEKCLSDQQIAEIKAYFYCLSDISVDSCKNIMAKSAGRKASDTTAVDIVNNFKMSSLDMHAETLYKELFTGRRTSFSSLSESDKEILRAQVRKMGHLKRSVDLNELQRQLNDVGKKFIFAASAGAAARKSKPAIALVKNISEEKIRSILKKFGLVKSTTRQPIVGKKVRGSGLGSKAFKIGGVALSAALSIMASKQLGDGTLAASYSPVRPVQNSLSGLSFPKSLNRDVVKQFLIKDGQELQDLINGKSSTESDPSISSSKFCKQWKQLHQLVFNKNSRATSLTCNMNERVIKMSILNKEKNESVPYEIKLDGNNKISEVRRPRGGRKKSTTFYVNPLTGKLTKIRAPNNGATGYHFLMLGKDNITGPSAVKAKAFQTLRLVKPYINEGVQCCLNKGSSSSSSCHYSFNDQLDRRNSDVDQQINGQAN